MSRSLVGSSSTKRFEARANSRASSSRERSPPESAPIFASTRVGSNRKSFKYPWTCFLRPLTSIQSPPPARISRTLLSGSSNLRCWSIMIPVSVLARVTLPMSGAISPVSNLSSVVLPLPFGANHADPVAALDTQGESRERWGARQSSCSRPRPRSPSSSGSRRFRARAGRSRPAQASPRGPRACRAIWRAGPGCACAGR